MKIHMNLQLSFKFFLYKYIFMLIFWLLKEMEWEIGLINHMFPWSLSSNDVY